MPCDHASASIRLVTGTRPARAARAGHAGPPLEQLKAFLETSLKRISGKSSLATAIRYSLSRLKALPRYVTDGRLEMSNNAAEHAMKSPVPGRKNYHFCSFDAGGQRAVCFYTILETRRMNGFNPQAYLSLQCCDRARHRGLDHAELPAGGGKTPAGRSLDCSEIDALLADIRLTAWFCRTDSRYPPHSTPGSSDTGQRRLLHRREAAGPLNPCARLRNHDARGVTAELWIGGRS